MQWKRRDSNARITLNLGPQNRESTPGRAKKGTTSTFSFRITRRRAIQVFGLAVLVLWWNWRNGDPLVSFPSWSGSGKTCVGGLTPPPNPSGPAAAGSGSNTALYTFPDSAEPFHGHYIPIRRSKRRGDDELRLENVLLGGGEEGDGHNVPGCLDDHISVGATCPELEELSPSNSRNDGKLDLVWAYANTSDHLHRFYYQSSSPPPQPSSSRWPLAAGPREFDELRYSLRSVLINFRTSAGQLTVIAPDYPFPGCGRAQKQWKLGQLPQWLKVPSNVPVGRDLEWWDGDVSLRLVHHSALVGEKGFPKQGVSFNSLGVEARLAYLEDVSDVFVYMNDDILFASPLSSEDFYSPQFGPIFRLQPDLLINHNKPKIGEWGPLIRTNELLDDRFGQRFRPYVSHTAKTLSVSHLREVASIWKEELGLTSSHAHRSTDDVAITVLQTHYTVERWREALLWSFIVATIGGDDDQWSEEQMRMAWMRMGGDPKRRDLSVRRGRRRTVVGANERAKEKTKVVFSSYDGYPYTGMGRSGFKEYPDFTSPDPSTRGNHQANRCTIQLTTCFTVPDPKGGTTTASDIFKNVAFRNPQCGDCILSALVTRSGETGLSALLPDPSRRFPTRLARGAASLPKRGPQRAAAAEAAGGESNLVARLPVAKSWEAADFTLRGVAAQVGSVSVRQWVLQAIYRYRFAIGSTSSTFVRLETPIQSNSTLSKLDERRGTSNDPALICINDDVRWEPEKIKDLLQGWMRRRWNQQAAWEV
ncbi:hypothetical protein FRC05_010899 [Tulasnella sp. 425]|nr:hypothetical protein FRC05_010899 [Tulasnella sp. 425]